MNRLINSYVIFLILILLFSKNISAKTIYYIKQSGTGDGTSWTNAAGNIQAIIDKAVSGDEVWVGKGTYLPTKETIARDNRSRTFLLKSGVNLYGGFAGNETKIIQRLIADLDKNGKIDSFEFVNNTVLSGNIDGINDLWTKTINNDGITWNWNVTGNENNCYHVVSGINLSGKTNFDGFTVIGGNSNESDNGEGGGIYDRTNKLIILNCIVRYCFAQRIGGGIASSYVSNSLVYNCAAELSGGGIQNWNGTVINCKVDNCSSKLGGGGGIGSHSVKSKTYIVNCEVNDCSAYIGGGINSSVTSISSSFGGSAKSEGTIERCKVFNCMSSEGGGISSNAYAKYIDDFSRSYVINCWVFNCLSLNKGGGIYFIESGGNCLCILEYCTINNCSSNSGGGIYIDSQDYIRNCIIANCKAKDIGGVMMVKNVTFDNNAITNNIPVNYSKVYREEDLKEIISPNIYLTFVNPTSFIGSVESDLQKEELLNSNWQLCDGSPCINNGDTRGWLDVLGNPGNIYGKSDIGAFEYYVKDVKLPVLENFSSLYSFKESEVLYHSASLNTNNDIKWSIENKKAIFSWKTNLTSSYTAPFFTYQINAMGTSNVILRYDLYFEAYSGTISPLGTEKLNIEYSTNFINWTTIASYSNLNGTIPKKTFTHDLGAELAGKSFFIRFKASGQNTNRIEKWEIDNIIIDSDGSTTTDLQMFEKETLKYSLNNGLLQIHNLNNVEILQLFDLNGRQIFNYKPTTYPIQLQLPNRGVYIVRTQSDVGVTNQKVVWE